MKYLYDGHTGSLYTSDILLDYKDLYCEPCNDSDSLIGKFETLKDFWSLIEDNCDIDGSGGWSLQYIFPIIVSEFDLPVEVTYDNYNEKSQGFCNFSDKEIVRLIKEYENYKSN